MTASKAPRPDASVSMLLNAASSLFRATLLKCLPFAMVAVLCLLSFATINVLIWTGAIKKVA